MRTAVVMAGGRGTRLRPLTDRLPKPMVLLDDHRPLMEFVVAALRASGIRRILAVLQFMPRAIVDHFGSGSRFGIAIDYLLQEGELGTAGSVRQALALFDDEDFLVASSDILFHGDLMPGMDFHYQKGGVATLALTRVEDPSGLGAVRPGSDGRILEFREKPGPGEMEGAAVNSGIYFLNRRALQFLPGQRRLDFGRDLFPHLLAEGAGVYGWCLPGYWRDAGTWSSLEAARRDLQEVPALRRMVTRWPAVRSGDGGRIWIPQQDPAEEWLMMDTTTIGQAAGAIWKHLSEEEGKTSTLARIQKLDGMKKEEALAALGWLAREGKVRFNQEGRSIKVQLSSP
jgi:mannose-1-phosphate guanylyltransferase/phosphomannomutase